ncbi:hypothetical protein EC991_008379 [Linnemannia zychae]|nr:hypothetical protein EC991_008379 [Linnemannia zychae]
MNTGDKIMEFGLSVFILLQAHFKTLPNTIMAKMRNLGYDDSKIPRLPGDDKIETAKDQSLEQEPGDELDEGGCFNSTRSHSNLVDPSSFSTGGEATDLQHPY